MLVSCHVEHRWTNAWRGCRLKVGAPADGCAAFCQSICGAIMMQYVPALQPTCALMAVGGQGPELRDADSKQVEPD